MTKKPEHSRPFNLEDAKAGAPYGCCYGTAAHVLKWDRNVSDYPILGCTGPYHAPAVWSEKGYHSLTRDGNLVMLPLGFCQSKPVFMGDELVTRFGDKFTVEAKHIGDLYEENTWPVPDPVYPKFDGSVDALSIQYTLNNNYAASLVRVANAALRHAVESGQVVLPGTAPTGANQLKRAFDEWHDKTEWVQREICTFPFQTLGLHRADVMRKEIERLRAAPSGDLLIKVAEAVLKASMTIRIEQTAGTTARIMYRTVDLAAIIASITGAKDAKEGAK